jgi:hypothetical protein
MVWTKQSILRTLKSAARQSADLSYNAMARRNQPLVSAAAYHFGSYRRACVAAGIDYDDIVRRPRWTRPRIIRLIKLAFRNDQDLHWSAVTSRRNELGRAAFAAIQPRLFGSWDRALHAAGLHAGDIARYRSWDRATIIAELKELNADGQPVNSGAVQKSDPGLHAAAIRRFRSYDAALRASGIAPASVRRRRSWTRLDVRRELGQLLRQRKPLTDSALRRGNPALYGAALRLFGSFKAARAAVE